MDALVARSSVLSPPAAAGDASPSPSPLRVSVALPRPRRSPSALAISTRWPRAHRRGGGRLLAGSGEGGSPDPAGDAGGKEEYFPLLEVLADALSGLTCAILCVRDRTSAVFLILYFSCLDRCSKLAGVFDSLTALILPKVKGL